MFDFGQTRYGAHKKCIYIYYIYCIYIYIYLCPAILLFGSWFFHLVHPPIAVTNRLVPFRPTADVP